MQRHNAKGAAAKCSIHVATEKNTNMTILKITSVSGARMLATCTRARTSLWPIAQVLGHK